jgi:hypothetical protein
MRMQPAELEQRIQRLERQLASARRRSALGWGGLGLAIGIACHAPDSARTELVIGQTRIDASGVTIGSTRIGETGVTIQHGREQLSLTSDGLTASSETLGTTLELRARALTLRHGRNSSQITMSVDDATSHLSLQSSDHSTLGITATLGNALMLLNTEDHTVSMSASRDLASLSAHFGDATASLSANAEIAAVYASYAKADAALSADHDVSSVTVRRPQTQASVSASATEARTTYDLHRK